MRASLLQYGTSPLTNFIFNSFISVCIDFYSLVYQLDSLRCLFYVTCLILRFFSPKLYYFQDIKQSTFEFWNARNRRRKKKHTDTQKKRAFHFSLKLSFLIDYHFDLVQIPKRRNKFPSSLLESSREEEKNSVTHITSINTHYLHLTLENTHNFTVDQYKRFESG